MHLHFFAAHAHGAAIYGAITTDRDALGLAAIEPRGRWMHLGAEEIPDEEIPAPVRESLAARGFHMVETPMLGVPAR